MHVLRAEADALGTVEQLGELGEGGEGRGEDDLDAVDAFDIQAEVFEEGFRLGDGHVHLPVGGDDFFTHGMTN